MKELYEIFIASAKVGALTFGGGYAMLPILQREIVENKGWNSEAEILDYYALAQCRPDVVPKGAVNFAFIGQFAETPRDTIFTTEYSMRTGMESVYTLLNVDRGVPEVWGSTYDLRDLINATVQLRDGKKITDMELPFIEKIALKEVLKKIQGTDIEKFLKEYNAI